MIVTHNINTNKNVEIGIINHLNNLIIRFLTPRLKFSVMVEIIVQTPEWSVFQFVDNKLIK
jgi:hypothetical protein